MGQQCPGDLLSKANHHVSELMVLSPGRSTTAVLSRAHSTRTDDRMYSHAVIMANPVTITLPCLVLAPQDQRLSRELTNYERTVQPVLDEAVVEIMAQKQEVARLKAVADQHPFYKYNGVWSRELQNLVRHFSWSEALIFRLY